MIPEAERVAGLCIGKHKFICIYIDIGICIKYIYIYKYV
jgi:hypothetical protein